MTKQTKLQRIGLFVLMTIALLFIADIQAFAQKKDYKPGEKIEYLAETYPKEVWEVGTFVEATPSGSQPIIRHKPNEFNPEGSQQATSWAKIRPLSAKTADRATVNNTEADNKTASAATTDFGTGLMTQEQIVIFLRTKIGDQPYSNPRLKELYEELAEMIKTRGVNFRYPGTEPDFEKTLAKYGANAYSNQVYFPLRDNYGEPTKESWLMGAWQLDKIGAAVDYTKNNRIYRQGEIGVGNVGTLSLKEDNTYVWKAANAKDSTSSKWRQATSEEMRHQGGFQIVLLKAKGGEDWIVMKDMNPYIKFEGIVVAQLNSRSIKELGSRGGKK